MRKFLSSACPSARLNVVLIYGSSQALNTQVLLKNNTIAGAHKIIQLTEVKNVDRFGYASVQNAKKTCK